MDAIAPLGVFNFSKKDESTESPGTRSCSIVADTVLPYKILILSFKTPYWSNHN